MVAYEVGYESSSQFSREYARKFGVPPRQDKAEATGVAAKVMRGVRAACASSAGRLQIFRRRRVNEPLEERLG